MSTLKDDGRDKRVTVDRLIQRVRIRTSDAVNYTQTCVDLSSF